MKLLIKQKLHKFSPQTLYIYFELVIIMNKRGQGNFISLRTLIFIILVLAAMAAISYIIIFKMGLFR